jgi:hypothetical protein
MVSIIVIVVALLTIATAFFLKSRHLTAVLILGIVNIAITVAMYGIARHLNHVSNCQSDFDLNSCENDLRFTISNLFYVLPLNIITGAVAWFLAFSKKDKASVNTQTPATYPMTGSQLAQQQSADRTWPRTVLKYAGVLVAIFILLSLATLLYAFAHI